MRVSLVPYSTIEVALAERPSLVFYRVLFGPPDHQVLKGHLLGCGTPGS
jgi:hypothetical protein